MENLDIFVTVMVVAIFSLMAGFFMGLTQVNNNVYCESELSRLGDKLDNCRCEFIDGGKR